MKVIKKYTPIKIYTQTVDRTVEVKLEYGDITGAYYSRVSPKEIFDTEQEAIEYAFETDKYVKWLILPLIQFDSFD